MFLLLLLFLLDAFLFLLFGLIALSTSGGEGLQEMFHAVRQKFAGRQVGQGRGVFHAGDGRKDAGGFLSGGSRDSSDGGIDIHGRRDRTRRRGGRGERGRDLSLQVLLRGGALGG